MSRFTESRVLRGLAFLLVSAALAACKHTPPEGPQQNAAAVNIETTVVHADETSDYLEIPARIASDPTRVVHIYPPLSGRITALRVLPGQEVAKGQQIALLQSGDVAQARSDFERAKIEVLRADRALTHGKLLLDHEVLSQADYYELEATDQADHSELERTRQRIHELGFSENGTSDETAIAAPIAGTVLDVGTANGELQRSLDNSTSIATIANLDTVWVVGDVFERDLSTIKTGRPVKVLIPAYDGLTLDGKVSNISDALDPATHTVKVRVVLANPGHRLKPDMFATIRAENAKRTSIIVPTTAVLHEGGATNVFLETAPGKYEQHPVTIGRMFEKTVEVTSGLRDGDKVVTTGAAMLRAPEAN